METGYWIEALPPLDRDGDWWILWKQYAIFPQRSWLRVRGGQQYVTLTLDGKYISRDNFKNFWEKEGIAYWSEALSTPIPCISHL